MSKLTRLTIIFIHQLVTEPFSAGMSLGTRWLFSGRSLILTLICLAPSACHGQADIFGGPSTGATTTDFGDPTATAPGAGGASSNLLKEDQHVVVQSLRRNPPKTAVEISRAILFMSRIERWDEVARYLDQLEKLPIDEATALKLTRSTGLETWFGIGLQTKKLSVTQRATAKKVVELSSGATRNPSTVENAVEMLRAAGLVDRKRGVLAIQAAGEAGLSAMLESIANSDKPPTPIMSETIITMGSEGEASLKAAISTPDEKSRAQFLQVASKIPGGVYMAELTTAIYTLAPDGEPYKQIRAALSPAGQAIPEAITSQRYVSNQMELQLNKFKSLRLELTTTVNSVWRWTADGKRLVTELDDAAGIHLERAYQLAILVNQLAQHTGVDSPLATAVILEHHHRLNPVIELDAANFQKAFQPKSKIEDLNFLEAVLDAAKKAELLAAQLRTVQAMDQALKKSSSDTSSTIKRLSDAVKNSAPAVRYAAAVALSHRAASDAAFEGRYALEQTKREILTLEAKPLAIVIGGSTELRDSLSNHLSLLGIRTLSSRSARETMRLIQEPQPIEYVFLVDQVLEMSLSEVVQRIRSHPRTRSLPLAVLTDRLGPSQRDLLANEGMTRIHYGYVTTNLELTSALLTEMRATSPVPKMDSLDRITLRSIFETSVNN